MLHIINFDDEGQKCVPTYVQKGDRSKEEQVQDLADEITVCAWGGAESEEQSVVTKVTWLNHRGSRYVANGEGQ